ncbi:endogenous retrovirus group PABLB member 1 Env polyprotein-like isoform X2 [Sciurus carolinensis]|uniref:endogenous retrovirus group PABLB member 1 Env polyprotein-like isoform X2 n=1 Tax=Sciurus carolinensis TaxID=30640 RepID=UPI001FB40C4C|nr:endogenous retrovirus group PABLB member 1 Env polyprotein-like isoform X2 [Sciurus carolinensis]
MGCEPRRAGLWLTREILGCCLIGLATSNLFLDWATEIAHHANQTDCWICSELPVTAAQGLPWVVQPANETQWTWLARNWSANTHPPKWPSYNYTTQKIFALIRETLNISRVPGYTYIWNGLSWEVAVQVTVKEMAFLCVTQSGHDNKTVGFMPDPLCKNTVNSADILSPSPNVTHGAFPLPWGALWICGSYGWPYLPYHWTGRCTWGWPYIPARVLPHLPQTPSNWESVKARHTRQRRASWWFYSLAVFSPQAAVIDVENQVSALASHTAQALNQTKNAITLLTEETTQIRKVVLQNRMALDMLMAAQGGVCAVLGTECCVYIPDNEHNITLALTQVSKQMNAIDALSTDPFSSWLTSLPSAWRQAFHIVLLSLACLLIGSCALFCCCGTCMQCASGVLSRRLHGRQGV